MCPAPIHAHRRQLLLQNISLALFGSPIWLQFYGRSFDILTSNFSVRQFDFEYSFSWQLGDKFLNEFEREASDERSCLGFWVVCLLESVFLFIHIMSFIKLNRLRIIETFANFDGF